MRMVTHIYLETTKHKRDMDNQTDTDGLSTNEEGPGIGGFCVYLDALLGDVHTGIVGHHGVASEVKKEKERQK